MKYLSFILIILFSNGMLSQSLSSVSSEFSDVFTPPKNDSVHSSAILSVSYESDTLFVKARHYAVCCEKFVQYVDKKEGSSQINFVVKSLEKGCICELEKIVYYKVYLNDLNSEVKLRINGKKPNYGIISFSNPHGAVFGKKKRRKNKIKEM